MCAHISVHMSVYTQQSPSVSVGLTDLFKMASSGLILATRSVSPDSRAREQGGDGEKREGKERLRRRQ